MAMTGLQALLVLRDLKGLKVSKVLQDRI